MKRKLLLLIIIVLIFTFSSTLTVHGNSLIQRRKTYYLYFRANIVVDIYVDSSFDHTAVFDNIEDILEQVHQVSTRHETFSGINNIKYINQNPGITHTVDPMIIEMIEMGLESYNNPLHHQKFNVALGSVLAIWSMYRNQCEDLVDPICLVPSLLELEAANTNSNPNNIVYDKTENTLMIPLGTQLDLGGIAKGYAARLIDAYLKTLSIDIYMINAGSSNVSFYGLNPHPDRDFWSIGLINPFNPNALPGIPGVYARIKVDSNQYIVTSGDYERTYEVEGVQYHHLIDPETLFPSTHTRSVTVVGSDPALGDIYSTLAFLLPIEDAKLLINSLEDFEAIWIDAQGVVHMSDHFESLYLIEILYSNDPENPVNNDPDNGSNPPPPPLDDVDNIMPIVVSLLVMFALISIGFIVVVIRERKHKSDNFDILDD